MKNIMLSIHPHFCNLIASGEKTIEVRKTRPNIQTPFKVYIYCTHDFSNSKTRKRKYRLWIGEPLNKDSGGRYVGNGTVIGEYICDQVLEYPYIDDGYSSGGDYLTLTRNEHIKMCLDYDELLTYGDGKTLYGWHISDLVIYDKPKELNEFSKYGFGSFVPLKRPPQSWCYVEEREDNQK